MTTAPHGFRYDTVFHLGAYYPGIGYAKYLEDSLHIDYTQTYKGPSSMQNIWDSTNWSLTDPGLRDQQRNANKFYTNLIGTNLKTIHAPLYIPFLNVSVMDNYFDHDTAQIHVGHFGKVPENYKVMKKDTVAFHGYAGGIFSTSPGEQFMAGFPSFTQSGVYVDDRDSSLRRLMHRDNGGPYDDSTDVYDLRVKIRSAGLDTSSLALNTVIAKTILYYRDTAGQSTCKCGFFVPYDTVDFTVRGYFGGDKNFLVDSTVGQDYREITTTFRMPTPKTYHALGNIVMDGTWSDTAQTIYTEWRQDSLDRDTTITITKVNTVVNGVSSKITQRDTVDSAHAVDWNSKTYISINIVNQTENHKTIFANGATVQRNTPANPNVPPTGWYNWMSAPTQAYCASLLESLKNAAVVEPTIINEKNVVEGSDIVFDIKSTGVVPITFLHSGVSPHRFTQLRQGGFDSAIHASIDPIFHDTVYQIKTTIHYDTTWEDKTRLITTVIDRDTLSSRVDTTLRDRLMRIGLMDEVKLGQYESWRILASKVQRRIFEKEPTDTRGIWANPYGDYHSLRIQSGDLDSTKFRMVHMIASQPYYIDGKIPVRYANPDLMDDAALATYYKPAKIIAFNTKGSYAAYLSQTDRMLNNKVGDLVKVVDIARYRYRPFTSNTFPVTSVVQVMGYLEHDDNNHGAYTNTWRFRPPTPEEITVQGWLALNCGVDGISFSDFTFDGYEFGVVPHYDAPVTDTSVAMEYRAINHGGNFPKPTLPKMWVGFGTRYNAVKRLTDAFRGKDSILAVYSKLDHNCIRMSVAMQDAHFSAMTLVDTLYTQQPYRLKNISGNYVDSATDEKTQTFVELSEFNPGPADSNQMSQYLIVTNRRTWPIDTRTYGPRTNVLSDSNAKGYDVNGYGPIDVRRPVIKLKAPPNGMIATQYRIRRIGSGSTWRTVNVGDAVELDWLDPGWGAMYQVVPIGISKYGTAYNNAVHAENLTRDTLSLPDIHGVKKFVTDAQKKFVVYERDSSVYLRVLDTNGVWGGEKMVSLPTDAQRLGTTAVRRANNVTPSIAVIRKAKSTEPAVLVVWERDSGSVGSIEACYYPNPSLTPGSEIRRRLSPQVMRGGRIMTPAVVAQDSGWVAAWSSPLTRQIEGVAIRNPTDKYLKTTDISAVYSLRASGNVIALNFPLDTVAAFPTLAARYDPALALMGNPDTVPYRLFHMAFQQGGVNGTYIFYASLKARYPSSGQPQLMGYGRLEHGSSGISGCNFIHPSIASDSVNVYLSFESVFTPRKREDATWVFNPYDPTSLRTANSTVTLRIRRDTIVQSNPPSWNTAQSYLWQTPEVSQVMPSVTAFPGRLRKTDTTISNADGIQQQIDGALVWAQWPTGLTDQNKRVTQQLYRFGENAPLTLRNYGNYPSMMLAPRVALDPAASTGVFYRSDDVARAAADRAVLGGSAWYYPSYLENGPGASNDVLLKPKPEGVVIKALFGVVLKDKTKTCLGSVTVYGGLGFRNPSVPELPGRLRLPLPPPPDDSTKPGLPPVFFALPPAIRMTLDSVPDVKLVTRTSVFTSALIPVDVHRWIDVNDSVTSLLLSAPFGGGPPSDVKILTELIRASDDAVLWSDDTISVRQSGDVRIDEMVQVPVPSVTPPGTEVYIQMRPIVMGTIEHSAFAGFFFGEDSAEDGGKSMQKVVLPKDKMIGASGSQLAVVVIPNPARDRAEVRLHLMNAGRLRVAVYDMLGRQVKALPEQQVGHSGEYVMELNLSDLGSGTYTVRADSGAQHAVTQMVVVR